MADRQTLVIIGNGMVSHALCRRLAALGNPRAELRVVVFGEEPRPAYDRVHLTDLLAGKPESELTLAPASWYAEQGIELHLGDPVVAIDRDECAVRSAGGRQVFFDRLVLATGSRAFVPPLPGADLPGVFVYRTVADLEAILAHARGAARAAVVGGGLLGLEAARAVQALGLDVNVIEASPRLLPRQLDEAGAALLQARIEALGVRVRTGARTARIEEAGLAAGDRPPRIEEAGRAAGDRPLRRLGFAAGPPVEAELIILAAGIRPRAELAAACGLALAPTGGVLVDDRLTTSDPRIFAVGECATHAGVTYGLAPPGYRMVDVLVHNLGGGDALFTGQSLSARLKLLGVEVASLGRPHEKDTPGATAHTYLAGGVYRKLVLASGRIVGAIAVGPWEDLARIEDALAEPRRFSFWDLRRFRGTGSLFLRSESPPVHEWPAEALVCGCLGVRRGALGEAERAGCITVEALSARTGAGTMCGSCKPLLADYLLRDRAESLPPSQLLRSIPPRSTLAPVSLVERAEDTPTTLRCNAQGTGPEVDAAADAEGPVTPTLLSLQDVSALRRSQPILPAPPDPALADGPLSVRTPGGRLPPRRPPLDTLHSVTNHPDGGAARELAPISAVPRSAIAALRDGALRDSTRRPVPPPEPSRPSALDLAPPSTRRATMPPLRPVSVPPGRLPSIPPARILAAPPSPAERAEQRRRDLLLGASAAASLAAALTLLTPALAPAPSFHGFHLATAIVDPVARQASGYGVVVFSLAGLALSLRKRVKRFTWSDLPALRALHGLVGVAAVACLALHTGLHLGVRLNRVLMLDFLALCLLGAAAGVLAAASGSGDPAAAEVRRQLVFRVHVVFFLPLPVLCALHVLGAWYF
jgi:nitrite reductase (NADH) large subunit